MERGSFASAGPQAVFAVIDFIAPHIPAKEHDVHLLLSFAAPVLHLRRRMDALCRPSLVLPRTGPRPPRRAGEPAGRHAPHHRHFGVLVQALPVVLCLLCAGGGHIRWRLAGAVAAAVVLLVGAGHSTHRLRHLLPGAGERCDQCLVRPLLGPRPGGGIQVETRDAAGVLRPDLHLLLHRLGGGHRHRAQQFLRQPLPVPLAHGDE